jgi:hypothetical protein
MAFRDMVSAHATDVSIVMPEKELEVVLLRWSYPPLPLLLSSLRLSLSRQEYATGRIIDRQE